LWQVQAELAALFARVCGQLFIGFGNVNEVLLGKQRLVSPRSASKHRSAGINPGLRSPLTVSPSITTNLVVMGLVHLVATRPHRRMLYNAMLCLDNLAQDVLRTVPV
jgi:hypothetical protein